MEKEVIIKPSFDVKSTFNASLLVLMSTKLKLYSLFLLTIILINLFSNFALEEKTDIISIIIPFLIFPTIILLSVFFIYRSTKKQIEENPRLKENIVYILNDEYFQEKGDSFEIKHFWKNIIKVVEKKDFFLIYIAKNKANFIRKSDLKNTQYDELKELLSSLNIKKSLK